MTELLITAATAFFVVIDPVGVGAIFAGLTASADETYKRRMAVRGTAIAAAILLLFGLFGEALMRVLGISVAAFRIAGGILLLLLAIDMLFARPSGLRAMTEPESAEADRRDDISVFPVAIPLIAGPGAVTSVILFMGRAEGWAAQLVVLGVLAAVLLATLLILLSAARIARLLGVTGLNVLDRLLGLLLAALACQFILDGVALSGVIR